MTTDRGFLAQLHLHTAESSRCAHAGGAEMARACRDAGYQLLVVTDHFLNANTTASPLWPWPRQVDALMAGYRAAKAEGDRIGLTVLFGWETMNDGPEFLTYGLGEDFLLANPDLAELDALDYLRRIKRTGGFVTHAHPYREAIWIEPFKPSPRRLEAFEVFNAHHDPSYNAPALRDARAYGLIELAGSDAHDVDQVAFGAMRLPEAVHDMDGLIAALRTRQCEIVEAL